MAEGQQVTFSAADYPELDGIAEGASIPKITMTGNKVVAAKDGQVTVEMGPCEFETENRADKDLRGMTGAPAPGSEDINKSYETEY